MTRPRKRGSAAALTSFALLAGGAAAQDPPPNVVVILSDDQGWADVGCNNPNAYTPSIDALAEHGPNRFGFDASYGSLAGAIGMYDHRYRAGEFAETWYRDGELVDGFENGVHATDLVAAEAVRFIERERPFFLYIAFHAVHTPLDERGRFVDRPTQLDPDDPSCWPDGDAALRPSAGCCC